VGVIDRRLLQKESRGVGGPPLNDSNKERKAFQLPRQLCCMMERNVGAGASPCPGREGMGRLFITGTNTTTERGRGRARHLQGERTTKTVSCARTCRGSSRWRLSGGYEVHLEGTLPRQGSSGRRAATDCPIHGVLTDWCKGMGAGSGGARRGRSSRTLPEGGSVVITAVAAMGGRGWATG